MENDLTHNTNHLSVVKTADGSNTLFNTLVGEHYHSKHGALQESRHVFLESGLKFFLEKEKKKEVSVLEVGFGTGLNFLITAQYCTTNQVQLHYTGIEANPLKQELLSETGYNDYISAELWSCFNALYPASLSEIVSLNDNCKLEVAACELSAFHTIHKYDVLYFDAFAAVHQPEMWTTAALEACTRYLKAGGIFVTYAITGNLKRAMKSLNFSIEKAPGAPGKREMLRAVKNG